MLKLSELLQWMEDEFENGNRIKAQKLYKIFCKYAKMRFKDADESILRNYKQYSWDIYVYGDY